MRNLHSKSSFWGNALLAVFCLFLVLQGCQKNDELSNESVKNNLSVKWSDNSFSSKSFEESNPVLKAATLSVVVNGGFENGFNGWTVYANGYGINGDVSKAWYVGQTDPYNSFYKDMHWESIAHSGLSGASAVGNGPTFHRLYQDVIIPHGFSELRFWIRWKNQYGAWVEPGQNFQILLKDINTDKILATVFSGISWNLPMFSGGGNAYKAYFEQRISNLTSDFAGQKVRLEIVSDVQKYFMFVDIDDIEIVQVGYKATLDIQPGGGNVVNLKSSGSLPVALLSEKNFDATTVDLSSITIANDSKPETPIMKKINGEYMASFEDVNGDGLLDLMMHFDIHEMANNGDLTTDTQTLKLNGKANNGIWVVAKDIIKTLH